jgi:putative endonuclease
VPEVHVDVPRIMRRPARLGKWLALTGRMIPTDHQVVLGKSGENYACLELERRGYEILHRRFRTRVGEIDVVARDGGTLVFIEVKARRSVRFGPPAEAVGPQKRHKLMQMASAYILARGLGNSRCRFDVVAVTFGTGERLPKVEIFKAAFDANG